MGKAEGSIFNRLAAVFREQGVRAVLVGGYALIRSYALILFRIAMLGFLNL